VIEGDPVRNVLVEELELSGRLHPEHHRPPMGLGQGAEVARHARTSPGVVDQLRVVDEQDGPLG
jgi:hypothetical protein